MPSISSLCKAVALSAALTSNNVLASEDWFLMAREGECLAIISLERKLPDIGGISDPDAFVAYLRGKGLKSTEQRFDVRVGKAVQVSVPEKGLSPIFVTAENCPKGRQ